MIDMADGAPMAANVNFKSVELADMAGGAKAKNVKVRKEFPESWIYEVIDDSGLVARC